MQLIFFIGVFLSIGDFTVVFLEDLDCITEADLDGVPLDADVEGRSKGEVLANRSSDCTGFGISDSSF